MEDSDDKKKRVHRIRNRRRDRKRSDNEPRIREERSHRRIRIDPNSYDDFDELEEMLYDDEWS